MFDNINECVVSSSSLDQSLLKVSMYSLVYCVTVFASVQDTRLVNICTYLVYV